MDSTFELIATEYFSILGTFVGWRSIKCGHLDALLCSRQATHYDIERGEVGFCFFFVTFDKEVQL